MVIDKRKILYIALFSLLFVYIYNPVFRGFRLVFMVYVIGIIYSALNLGAISKLVNKSLKLSFLLFVTAVLIMYSLSYDVLLGSAYRSNSFWRVWAYLLFDVCFVALPLFVFLNKNRVSKDFLYNAFINLAVLQSIFALVMFVLPGLKELIFLDILDYQGEKVVDEALFGLRGFGIGSGFLFSLPLFQSLSIILIVDKAIKSTFKPKYLLYVFLITVSILINARIGLVVFPIMFIAYYITFSQNVRKLVSISFLIIIGGILFVSYYTQIRESLIGINSTFRWVITGFELALGISGTTGQSVLDILIGEHWHFPNKLSQLVFGTGEYVFAGASKLYGQSDIGYIQYIYFGGIFILLFAMSFFMLLVKFINKTKFFSISIILLLLIAHFKGNIFASNDFTRALILLSVCSFLGNKFLIQKTSSASSNNMTKCNKMNYDNI
ncbi:hypothetical protein CK503_13505 [Aliifodinibius salipaludis]|uniref:O-antigen ligase domain-containing protein n=1 Tax=Fodinibius salipaludis TaxID=2032627 RepID=A0A2A2G7S0_9BACT|nr:hypothetical protein [Aliifodinibius salipaludis]PAU93170.1 hypothetical protein CK503_13505 [Aliifodinibius salipaludis]